MEIIYKDLTEKYRWEEIEPVISLLYPTAQRSLAEYKEAYQNFSTIIPIKTRMRIIIEKNEYSAGGFWYEVYGRNGTLVKEAFQAEKARQALKDILEEEQGYGLSYTDWAEFAGMTIDLSTLKSFPEKDIVVHILVEMTGFWHSEAQSLKVIEEIKEINEGREQNLVRKEKIGPRGFVQIWSVHENGTPHGWYTVYWKGGAIIEQQGIMINGSKEGIWTYWDQAGKIKRQIRYWCDRVVEEKSEEPWWNEVEDQKNEN